MTARRSCAAESSTHSNVTMSLQHAKVFAKVLQDNLRVFEKTFGEIQVIEASKLQSVSKQPEEYTQRRI